MAQAAKLPQPDASSLVDGEGLEAQVQDMYRQVAREEETAAPLRDREGPRPARRLSARAARRDPRRGSGLVRRSRVSPRPRDALAGRAGARSRLGLGYRCVLRSRSIGPSGRVVGVDITDEQTQKAARLRDREGLAQVHFAEASIEALPFEDATFDAVISNGVINLSPIKDRVFSEAARVLRPSGRLAIADIVSGKALKERTRRNVELGRLYSRRDPSEELSEGHRGRRLSESTSYETTTTSSSPIEPSTRAAPTTSRASRWPPCAPRARCGSRA